MLPVLTLLPITSLVMLAALSSADLQRLAQYDTAWADADARDTRAQEVRGDFAGRGVEVADHFLTHTDPKPLNDAYFFVLRSVGDADTALTLIQALAAPPARQSGGLDRHFGEIGVAIEAVLSDSATASDPRIAAVLERAIATSRGKPSGSGTHEALEAVRLMGMVRSDEAAGVLARLSADPDAEIRRAAAEALGRLGPLTGAPDPGRPSPMRELLRLLAADPSPTARRQAAESLWAVAGEDADIGLRAALLVERDPRVIDAVMQSLLRRGAAVDDPAQCRDLIGRTWEAGVAQQMLDCWLRQGATPEELTQAALSGTATQRAVALLALTSSGAPASPARSLLVEPRFAPVRLDPQVGDRLLEAAVWVLSQGDAISSSTRDAAELALWNLSGGRMDRSIEYADRVTPRSARFRASAALARTDADAYNATRRPRQATIALCFAVGFGVLAVWRRSSLGRPAMLMGLSAAGWALWIVLSGGVTSLPPPPLQFFTVAALAFLAAGTVAGGAAVVSGRARGGTSAPVWIAATMMAAALLGGAVCAVTRSAGLFPSDMAGWEQIVDPLGAALLAAVVAAGLAGVNVALPRSRDASGERTV